MRKAGKLPEVLLWQQVHKGKFKGYDFDRQKIIGNYIVDFYCTNCHVVIEVDGGSFDPEFGCPKERDEFLEGLGLTVIHVTSADILRRLEQVMWTLNNHPALRAPLQRRGI